ncbi:phage virion morphogenesis protein [Tenacibaculum maritimum]|uniref:phage virion morphogenesis protein n=1 Tax=Tenacibaculum maritimum TaxID=107401 RepID=UPI0012E43442|nr:phage virion morphogenesis protein [Tenacibaculum maritimum]CAA0230747.1 conserved hypothetical protein [Tenacibaculum maritimum]
MSKINSTPDFSAIAKKLKRNALIIAKKEGVDWFVNSFNNEGFTGSSFEKWEDRKTPMDYKLLQASSYLKNSIQVVSASNKKIVFGSDAPYSKIHNEGGIITVSVTKRSRKYFWYMYKATKKEYWKWMALTKKNRMTIRIPKRQFMGESEGLMKKLNNKISIQIQKEFKNI